jgi:hypothetical protein
MLEDIYVPGLDLERLAVEYQQCEEEQPAHHDQADHNQVGDERLGGHHKNK